MRPNDSRWNASSCACPGKHETMPTGKNECLPWDEMFRDGKPNRRRLEISPLEMDACEPSAGPLRDIRLVDRTLVALADCVQVVSLRPDGRTERLLHERLKDDRFPKASIYIGIDDRDQYELALLDRVQWGWRAAYLRNRIATDRSREPKVNQKNGYHTSEVTLSFQPQVPFRLFRVYRHRSLFESDRGRGGI